MNWKGRVAIQNNFYGFKKRLDTQGKKQMDWIWSLFHKEYL